MSSFRLEEKLANVESENKVLRQQAVSMAPSKILSGRSKSNLQVSGCCYFFPIFIFDFFAKIPFDDLPFPVWSTEELRKCSSVKQWSKNSSSECGLPIPIRLAADSKLAEICRVNLCSSILLVLQESNSTSSPKKEYDIDDKPQKSLNEKQQVCGTYCHLPTHVSSGSLLCPLTCSKTVAGEPRSIDQVHRAALGLCWEQASRCLYHIQMPSPLEVVWSRTDKCFRSHHSDHWACDWGCDHGFDFSYHHLQR